MFMACRRMRRMGSSTVAPATPAITTAVPRDSRTIVWLTDRKALRERGPESRPGWATQQLRWLS